MIWQAIDHNSPDRYNELTPEEQDAIRRWIRLALTPSSRPSTGNCSFSYGLKHRAETALKTSISNGEMKGAMLAEGYKYARADEDNINWHFNSNQRCPHYMGARRDSREHCPFDGHPYMDISIGHAPALCQASPAELGEFERLSALAKEAREARRAILRQQAEA